MIQTEMDAVNQLYPLFNNICYHNSFECLCYQHDNMFIPWDNNIVHKMMKQ